MKVRNSAQKLSGASCDFFAAAGIHKPLFRLFIRLHRSLPALFLKRTPVAGQEIRNHPRFMRFVVLLLPVRKTGRQKVRFFKVLLCFQQGIRSSQTGEISAVAAYGVFKNGGTRPPVDKGYFYVPRLLALQMRLPWFPKMCMQETLFGFYDSPCGQKSFFAPLAAKAGYFMIDECGVLHVVVKLHSAGRVGVVRKPDLSLADRFGRHRT